MSQRYTVAAKASVNHPAAASYLLEPGDIVFARTGASVGKSYLYDAEDGNLVFAGFLIRISPDPKSLVPGFLSFYAQSGSYWNWVKAHSQRSGQPGINAREFASLPIQIPTRCRTRGHRRGTWRRRRPHRVHRGSSSPRSASSSRARCRSCSPAGDGCRASARSGRRSHWENSRIVTGYWRRNSQHLAGPALRWRRSVVHYPTDVTALSGFKYLTSTARTISQQGLGGSSAELIPANSVLMTSRATIGECAINLVPVSTNQGFKNFVPREAVDVEFFYYLLLDSQKQGFIKLSAGRTFLEIGKRQLVRYELRLPPTRTEQAAIANVLSDIERRDRSLSKPNSPKRAH